MVEKISTRMTGKGKCSEWTFKQLKNASCEELTYHN